MYGCASLAPWFTGSMSESPGPSVDQVLIRFSRQSNVVYTDLDALGDDSHGYRRSGFIIEVRQGDLRVEISGMAASVNEWWATATSHHVVGQAQDWMDYRYGEGFTDDQYDRLMAQDLDTFLTGLTTRHLRLEPHPKRPTKKAILYWETPQGESEQVIPFTAQSFPGDPTFIWNQREKSS